MMINQAHEKRWEWGQAFESTMASFPAVAGSGFMTDPHKVSKAQTWWSAADSESR